jgi:phosphatidylserine/phosphatidylglycerophosphate/cardiolipin synthase-like enzyme
MLKTFNATITYDIIRLDYYSGERLEMLKIKNLFLIFLLLFCCLFLLAGCDLKIHKLFPKPAPISNLSSNALFIDKDAIYNKTISLIQSAQSSIYVEQAQFDDPRLIQLLLDKSRSGIDVRILLDQWQKVNQTTLEQLKSQNVSIQFYPAQRGQIDHTKYLIVDQKRALIYGPSWTANGFAAHDLAVELTGKSVWRLASLFSDDWAFTTTYPIDIPSSSPLPEDNIVLATNSNVKQEITNQISSSTKSICIENTELTDPDIVQALLDVAKKGCSVRLILDRSIANETPVTINKLKVGGIQIRYYPNQTPFGMNLAIFDNKTFILSSSGWTHYTFIADHEFSITVPSPVASNKLENLFNQDWDKSSE